MLLKTKDFITKTTAFASFPILASGLFHCTNTKAATIDVSSNSALPPLKLPPAPKNPPQFDIGYTAGCPRWMVRVPVSGSTICIDRFEDHLVRKGEALPHATIPTGRDFAASADPKDFPQSSISRFQAAAACSNAGKRLCTMFEWKTACMGVERNTYPYGNYEESGKCNTGRPHLLTILHGNDSRRWSKSDMNDPLLSINKSKPGAFLDCVSSFGAFDMVGNLHEWVSDYVDEKIMGSMPYIGKDRSDGPKAALGNGIFMGGFHGSANQNGNGCNYATIAHPPDHYDYSVGFRCCKDVEEIK